MQALVSGRGPKCGSSSTRKRFEAMVSARSTHFPIAIVAQDINQIVKMGTSLINLKSFKGLTRVAHVEDIAVDISLQNKDLGKIIAQTLIKLAEQQ